MIYLKPSEIRYTQDSISNIFGGYGEYAYRLIGESLDDLLKGRCTAESIPTISVIERQGKYYSSDNRRLWVFKKAEQLGELDEIPVYETCYLPEHKLTTCNDGSEIKVRRDPGGSIWRYRQPKSKTVVSQTKRTPLQEIKANNTYNDGINLTTGNTSNTNHSENTSKLRCSNANGVTPKENVNIIMTEDYLKDNFSSSDVISSNRFKKVDFDDFKEDCSSTSAVYNHKKTFNTSDTKTGHTIPTTTNTKYRENIQNPITEEKIKSDSEAKDSTKQEHVVNTASQRTESYPGIFKHSRFHDEPYNTEEDNNCFSCGCVIL